MGNNLGEFLKERRKMKELTQKELASMLFVSESAVSKWEKNVARPDISLLPKLSQILEVSEHEIITASMDDASREEKNQAKKWRTLSFTWSLFFYISYAIALIPCFICNLAINKTLSWFWIVLAALILAFTFTNLPKLIKKHRLILLPLSNYIALQLLLGVCCIYTHGHWFFISLISTLLGFVIIFIPLYIAKFPIFNKIKKYNDFISIFIDFILLNILLIVINIYTFNHTSNQLIWYISIALPIVVGVYLILNIILSVRFLKINKLLKTSIILSLINISIYLPPLLIKVENENFQKEINDINILKADLANWKVDECLENNVHLIIFLTLLGLSIIFLISGIIIRKKNK